ncbi:MAG: UDP-N-acetylmuramoyl-tripeptide--D-alanyl-D-alanine ligase [Gemmatimonadota bacterium]
MAERLDPGGPPVPLPAWRVREALGEPLVPGDAGSFAGVAIDSRALRRGCLFVALRGERHDGNDFVAEAARSGAAGVVSAGEPSPDHPRGFAWWRVPDGAAALRRLAVVHRAALPARVVCVTGSNGKTGTKELAAEVLAQAYPVARTRGNLNSLIGLPLSLLELSEEHVWGVFEIGTSRVGEIAQLAAMARPDVGVITNVGPSHLEGLSSLEGVVREKTDLAAALGREGTLVFGGDGELLRAAVGAFSCARVSFGLERHNDVHPERWELDAQGRPVFDVAGLGEVRLRLVGLTSLLNALAAVAVGRVAGVTPAGIRRGLETAEPLPLRLEVLREAGVTIIQDCYNADPDSMRRGLETLRALGSGPRVAVLGGMRELGGQTETLHYDVGREIGRQPLDLLLVYGEEAMALARGYQSATDAPVYFFRDYAALARFLHERIAAPATVLFKASRGVALENVAREYLVELRGRPRDVG